MHLSCDEQNLCFVLLPPGIPSHSLPFSSFLIPSFHKICALSATSCLALETIGDFIHKQYTTCPMLLIHGGICITNGKSWCSLTCSLLQTNSVETLLNELFNEPTCRSTYYSGCTRETAHCRSINLRSTFIFVCQKVSHSRRNSTSNNTYASTLLYSAPILAGSTRASKEQSSCLQDVYCLIAVPRIAPMK